MTGPGLPGPERRQPFQALQAVAAPLPWPNVDTDRIVPARFIRKPRALGYGQFLFHDVRLGADGGPDPGFVLNQASYRPARVLVAAENFGCGSSREAAVWALVDAGFRAVIAPSFGDIFAASALRNGLLPVALPAADVARMRETLASRPGAKVTVDLGAQTVTGPEGTVHRFEIDPFARQCLLEGREEIELTMAREEQIQAFEARQALEWPWLDRPSKNLGPSPGGGVA